MFEIVKYSPMGLTDAVDATRQRIVASMSSQIERAIFAPPPVPATRPTDWRDELSDEHRGRLDALTRLHPDCATVAIAHLLDKAHARIAELEAVDENDEDEDDCGWDECPSCHPRSDEVEAEGEAGPLAVFNVNINVDTTDTMGDIAQLIRNVRGAIDGL